MLRLGLSLILRSARERISAAAGRKQFCKNNRTQPGNCLPLGLLLCRRPHSLQGGGREFTAARTSLPASRLQCCKLRISSGLCFSWELQVHFQNYYSQFDMFIALCPLLVPRGTLLFGGGFTWNAKGVHFPGAEEGARRPCSLAEPRALPGCLDRDSLPSQRAPGAPPARPPFPLCVPEALGAEPSAPRDAAVAPAMGSAPSPKAGGGCRSSVVQPHRLGFRGEGVFSPCPTKSEQ